MSISKTTSLIFWIAILAIPVSAQDPATPNQDTVAADQADQEKEAAEKVPAPAADDELKVETVVAGLSSPFALAIQPQTGHVFVADSGALRVVRIVGKEIQPVIIEFSKSSFGPTKPLEVGPMGLAFLDKDTLVVAGGRDEKGHAQFGIYKIPAIGKDPIKAEQAEAVHRLGPVDDEKPDQGIAYSMLATAEGIYVTTTIESAKGWLLHADRVGKDITDFKRFVSTKEKTTVGMPFAITRSFEAGYIVVGEVGTMKKSGDALLSFFDETGDLLGKYGTGLNDIVGLAYGPKRGRLFAIDFNALEPTKSGLFKLIKDGETGCQAVKITELVNPTALAFDPAGNLYITSLGTDSGSASPSGQLFKISGLDNPPKPKTN